jgi:L-ribulose-5-phosphate 4-epimerase
MIATDTLLDQPGSLMPELTPRQELALLARALWREGYDDHVAGHITYKQGDGTFLCTAWPLLWSELRPEDVIRIDADGNLLEGSWQVPPGIPLHLELHRLRGDVEVAMHNHPQFGTVWANSGRVPPCYDQTSALYRGKIALVNEYGGPVDDHDSARRAVESMGTADVALLAHHGVFVLGDSIRAVHLRAVALEYRCRMAWRIAALGGGTPLPDSVMDQLRMRTQNNFPGLWESMVRQELRADPSLLAAAF